MKFKFCVLTFIIVFQSIFGQDNPTSDTLNIKKVSVSDTIIGLSAYGDLPTTVVKLSDKDTLLFDLKDTPAARTIDSTWLNELYNSSRFEEIYGSITEEDFEPVE